MKRNKHGFTLVELLVVIGIIGLLISILVPAINTARIYAWTLVCKTNMRSMGMGFAQYGNDNKNLLPPQAFWNTSPYWNNYTPLPTTINYHTRYLKASAASNQGPVTLMKPFGIGCLYDSGLVKEFELFYCPGFRPRNNPNDPNYTKYRHDSYVHPTTGEYYTSSEYVLSGYHYFKFKSSQTNEIANRTFVYDLIYDWSSTPHASAGGIPKGLNVLYGDGRVEFKTDCFDETVWGKDNPSDTPNVNLGLWFSALLKVADSTTAFELENVNKTVGWNNFQCPGTDRDSSRGTRSGTWSYSY